MSFIHQVRVGFFGPPQEATPAKDLNAEESVQLLRRYNECALEDMRLLVEPVLRGTPTRGIVLGSTDGHPILLKAGMLICPYLATSYISGSICFVAFLHKLIGCSIYSEDEGKFLSLEEFVPRESFRAVMEAALQPRRPSAVEPGTTDSTSPGKAVDLQGQAHAGYTKG